jgi:hypothetical protein
MVKKISPADTETDSNRWNDRDFGFGDVDGSPAAAVPDDDAPPGVNDEGRDDQASPGNYGIFCR